EDHLHALLMGGIFVASLGHGPLQIIVNGQEFLDRVDLGVGVDLLLFLGRALAVVVVFRGQTQTLVLEAFQVLGHLLQLFGFLRRDGHGVRLFAFLALFLFLLLRGGCGGFRGFVHFFLLHFFAHFFTSSSCLGNFPVSKIRPSPSAK